MAALLLLLSISIPEPLLVALLLARGVDDDLKSARSERMPEAEYPRPPPAVGDGVENMLLLSEDDI